MLAIGFEGDVHVLDAIVYRVGIAGIPGFRGTRGSWTTPMRCSWDGSACALSPLVAAVRRTKDSNVEEVNIHAFPTGSLTITCSTPLEPVLHQMEMPILFE